MDFDNAEQNNTTSYIFMDNIKGLQDVTLANQHSTSFLIKRLDVLGIDYFELTRSITSLFFNSPVISTATKCRIVFQKYYSKTKNEERYKEMFSYFGSKFQRESTKEEQKQAIEQRKATLLESLIKNFTS